MCVVFSLSIVPIVLCSWVMFCVLEYSVSWMLVFGSGCGWKLVTVVDVFIFVCM